MRPKRKSLYLCFLSSLQLLSATVDANYQISTDMLAERTIIEFLKAHDGINAPLSTWPMDRAALDNSYTKTLESPNNALAYDLLQRQDGYNNNPLYFKVRYDWHSETQGISTGPKGYEPHQARAELSYRNDNLYTRLNLSYALDDASHDFRYDGSEISYSHGGWSYGFGLVDRHWGPGWDSSLILSDNARPVPSLYFTRNTFREFDMSWLSWVGKWNFTGFAGQLESSREIPRAKLLGLRFVAQPLPYLELGFSRTAQWGGSGRTQSIQSLFESIIGNNNDNSNPGNQLAGFDASWKVVDALRLYMQLIGEDEAGLLPSKKISLIGTDYSFQYGESLIHLYLEQYDTGANQRGKGQYNIAYEHSVYKTGYRHKGRVMATPWDNDSAVSSIGASLLNQFGFFNIKYRRLNLNYDAVGSNSIIAEEITEGKQFIGAWRWWNKNIFFELEVSHLKMSKPQAYLFNDLGTTYYAGLGLSFS